MPTVRPRRLPALCLTLLFGFAAGPASATPTSTIEVVKKKKAPAPVAPREAEARRLVERPAPPRPLPKPRPAPAPALAPAVDTAAPAAGSDTVAWVALGGSVAAGVAGAIFMGRSISALNEDVEVTVKNNGDGTSTVALPEEYRAQQTRILTNGVAGTVLLSTAVAGTVASLIALLSD